MSHTVESCPLTKLNGGLSRLDSADEDAVLWLTSYGSWHTYKKKTVRIKMSSVTAWTGHIHPSIHPFINTHKAAVIIKYKNTQSTNEQKNIQKKIKFLKNSNKSSANGTYNGWVNWPDWRSYSLTQVTKVQPEPTFHNTARSRNLEHDALPHRKPVQLAEHRRDMITSPGARHEPGSSILNWL